ncbi:hypothetical protein IQ250_26165 [Pseudanabaenaceae cyanobacterium LEGE 13415]|nr:hypothetical protein [Pseudanabaenaceae cyanobacterium LEGE 13415]
MQEPTASPTAATAAPDLVERERQETEHDRRIQVTGDTNTKLANNLNVRVSDALYNDLSAYCSGKVTDEGEFLTPSKLIRRLIIREIYSQPDQAKN